MNQRNMLSIMPFIAATGIASSFKRSSYGSIGRYTRKQLMACHGAERCQAGHMMQKHGVKKLRNRKGKSR